MQGDEKLKKIPCAEKNVAGRRSQDGFSGTKKTPSPSHLYYIFSYFCKAIRDISSVGLERLLDRQEVTGSNPVYLTN